MNRFSIIIRQKIISIIMLFVSILGGIFIYFYIGHIKSSQYPAYDSQEIILAVSDIYEGDTIIETNITTQNIPEAIFSDRYILEKESVIGKTAAEDILEGEILTREKISGFKNIDENTKSISSYIPQHLKAVSVPIVFYSDISLLRNGDHVDIISVYYDKDANTLISETILNSEELISLHPSGKANNPEVESNIIFDNLEKNSQRGMAEQGNAVIATFFLDVAETEKIFLALERGVLNIAICSKNIYGNI